MTLPAEILAHYAEGEEQERLSRSHGRLELLRTQDILQRHLPPPPARILDVGGGPGVYAEWLAGLGYTVHLVDPVPLHVEQASRRRGVMASLGDARALAAADASYDAVLALGPLYHLPERSERIRAWREFGRVVVPGGLIAAAAISRFAAWNDGLRQDWLLREGFAAVVELSLHDGRHRNDDERPGLFTTAYFHHPDELSSEPQAAGLGAADVLAVEVTGWLIGGLPALLDDPARRSALLDWLRRVEAEPSLHGASAHLLALVRRRPDPHAFAPPGAPG